MNNCKLTSQELGVFVVNQTGQVATVVQDHVEGFTIFEGKESLFNAPNVFFVSFTFPSKDGDTASSDGSSSVILSRENVARRPANFSTEFNQSFNEDASLNGHVQTTGNTSTGQRLGGTVFFTKSHQTRHFIFGNFEFFTTKVGQRDIGCLFI